MNQKSFSLKKFCIIGVFFVILAGSLLHFLYEWSGNNVLVSFFAPISESVWEHFKLGFYSLLLYNCITYPFIKTKVHNFVFALGISSIGLNLTIGILFYFYDYFIHHSILWLDLFIYILGVLIAFLILYRLMTLPPLSPIFNWIGLLIILITISLFITFTINPLTRFDLFKDPTI